jgi:preprotein translocase subunit SecE
VTTYRGYTEAPEAPTSGDRRRRRVAQLAEHRSPKPGVGGSSPSAPAKGSSMNRQMKRAQEKAERLQKGSGVDRRAAPPATTRRAAQQEKRKRAGVRQFLREVRLELKKVDWPTRKELITYTVVVLVTITVLTSFVFAIDWVFAKLIFNLLD